MTLPQRYAFAVCGFLFCAVAVNAQAPATRIAAISTPSLVDAPSAVSQPPDTGKPEKPKPSPVATTKPGDSRPGGAGNNFRDFMHQIGSPLMPLIPAASAGVSMYTTKDSQFGSGAEGYGNRYAVAFGDQFNGMFLRYFLMPTMFNQVEHYEPVGNGYSAESRIGHAFAHSFVTKTRNGHHTINMSGVPASAAVAAIGMGYYPDMYTDRRYTLRRAAYAQAGYFAGDLWTEFKPDICRALHLPCGKQKR